MRNWITKIAREPLVHFLFLGALIYVCSGLFAIEKTSKPDNTIRISAAKIHWMETLWQERWNRPPTPLERSGLIKEYIRETVLYREALAMGLDKDDTIVRRRLAQKLAFLSQDLLNPNPPSEQERKAYFIAHTDRYETPALITFTHVYIDPDKRGKNAIEDAKKIKTELLSRKQPIQGINNLGDPILLQRYYPARTKMAVSKLFGREFSREIFALPTGKWSDPVMSGYGLHLVYVHNHTKAEKPKYSDVKGRVGEDWKNDEREELNDKYYARLLAHYNIIIEDKASNTELAVHRRKPNE